jgi:hypothetical protein
MKPKPNCKCGKPRLKDKLWCADCMAAYRKLWSIA